MTTLHTFAFWQGNALILLRLRRIFQDYNYTHIRIFYTILAASAYTIVASYGLTCILYMIGANDGSCLELQNFVNKLRMDFALTALVGTIYESTYFFQKWKQSMVEAEKLKSQHIQSQFEVLKNQVSPHFLFNSLNTLITIIPENPELAVEFTEKLSKVYRYILQNKDKELVPLSTELSFVKSYVFLLKIRFGDNLTVNYDIDTTYLNDYVAPLTLQMLVENAIKHNIISVDKPLQIHIYVENGTSVIVKNNLQLKTLIHSSTKVGLNNIKQRYYYLSHQAVDIITTTQNFLVALPLIKHYGLSVYHQESKADDNSGKSLQLEV
ncbi:MAG: histidine kinase [Bacteroidia bacterium]|nr:histidine kinase [Bacteroidia bacterium]